METKVIDNVNAQDQDDELKGFKTAMIRILLSVCLAGLISLYISWEWTVAGLMVIVWLINRDGKKVNSRLNAVFCALAIIALALLSMAIYFDPLDIWFYGINLSGFFSFLTAKRWPTVVLIVVAVAVIWGVNQDIKKEQAERRLANKILTDQGVGPLEGTWFP